MTNALVTLHTAIGLASCEPCICDVDGSGNVGATDALVVRNWCFGLRAQPDQCPELGALLAYQVSTTTSASVPASTTTSITRPY